MGECLEEFVSGMGVCNYESLCLGESVPASCVCDAHSPAD